MFVSGTDKLPAPGTYNPKVREKVIQYSMRPKFEDRSDQWIKKVPGPGTYNQIDTINEHCKNFVSKYETAATAKFSILPRLTKDKMPLSPGPAQYDSSREDRLKFHAPVANKFTVSQRKGLTDSTTKVPGPG